MSNNIEQENTATMDEVMAVKSDEKPQTFGAKVKEFFRKFIVGLKRRPHNIAMFVYVIALLVYSLNLTSLSNTTAYINMQPMGLCQFVAMLLSILGAVCMLNVYPKRQKPNYIMLALFFVMVIVIIVCDIGYRIKLDAGIASRFASFTKPGDAEAFNQTNGYLYRVQSLLVVHIIILGVSSILFALSPVIGKLLKKINTSVDIEYNTKMAEIEREDD